MQCDAITTFAEYDVDHFIEAIETAVQYQHEIIIHLNLLQNLLETVKEWYLYKLNNIKHSILCEDSETTVWCSVLHKQFIFSVNKALEALQKKYYTVKDAVKCCELTAFLYPILHHSNTAKLFMLTSLALAWHQINDKLHVQSLCKS